MDSANQFTYFCLCVLSGFIGGIFYEPFALLRILFGCNKGKNRVVGNILDILFCLTFTFLCIIACYLFHFPDFRLYMFLGFGVGIGIYLKSLHRILAFFQKVCYNMLTKLISKAKKTKKNSVKEVG